MSVRITTGTSDGRIATVSISRPNFSASMRHAMPLDSGQDRRHAVAWVVLRDLIIQDISGMTLPEARDYLASRGVASMGSSLGEITAGVATLASNVFNDPGNLRPGPSAQNRILGGRINGARRLMDLPDSAFPRPLDIRIVDEDGSVSWLSWTIQNRQDAIDLFFNMALDWGDAADVARGQTLFTSLIENNGERSNGQGGTRGGRQSDPISSPPDNPGDDDMGGDGTGRDGTGGDGTGDDGTGDDGMGGDGTGRGGAGDHMETGGP